MDDELGLIFENIEVAIAIVDRTEPELREMIETAMMGVTPEKANLMRKRIHGLMNDITMMRTNAIKLAFKQLRDHLPFEGEKLVYGQTFATHAQGIIFSDVARIRQAIERGALGGLSNTDIAHLVIGSRTLSGRDGQTEHTRQLILRVAKGYLRQRKGGMVRSPSED